MKNACYSDGNWPLEAPELKSHYHDNALQFIQSKLVCTIPEHTNTFTCT